MHVHNTLYITLTVEVYVPLQLLTT